LKDRAFAIYLAIKSRMKKLNNKILEIEEAIWQGNLIWIINKKYALI